MFLVYKINVTTINTINAASISSILCINLFVLFNLSNSISLFNSKKIKVSSAVKQIIAYPILSVTPLILNNFGKKYNNITTIEYI